MLDPGQRGPGYQVDCCCTWKMFSRRFADYFLICGNLFSHFPIKVKNKPKITCEKGKHRQRNLMIAAHEVFLAADSQIIFNLRICESAAMLFLHHVHHR